MAFLYFVATTVLGVGLNVRQAIYSEHILNLGAWIDMPDVGNPTFSIMYDYVGVGPL